MKTVACPKCSFANTDPEASSACAQCGEPLASALLQENLDAIRKLTEKVQELTAPTFTSFNGFGTTLLDYRRTREGSWEATRWVIALGMPVVPLATYRIEPERQEASHRGITSHLKILAKGRLSAARVLRVYALVFVGLFPIVWGSLNNRLVNRTLGGGYAALAMIACVAWGAYIIFVKLKNDGKAYRAKAGESTTAS